MTVVVGTAGHIDHGKTALLRALTGIDADRLPEERRRGMTIDVGYAHLRLPDGTELDFVDVPGHDRLVGNMLVGAGEIDAVLLVIAADDGPRAQTHEHLALIDALGIRPGVVALTKIDLVSPDRVAEVADGIRAMVAGTTLEDAPVLPVSAHDGSGLAELSAALVELRDEVLARLAAESLDSARPVRLAIDRAFVVRGRGVVATGSLRGGRLERGTHLRLMPDGRTGRAREIQVHGSAVERVAGGGRVALNLAGVVAADLHRGMVLTTDPRVAASSAIVALLGPGPARSRESAGRAWPPRPGATFRLHLGTDQVEAILGRGRRDHLLVPDGRLVARLRLAHPIAVADGDRFLLRRDAPDPQVIGGRVLDARPPIGPSARRATPERLAALASADPHERERALLGIHGILDPARLEATEPDAGRLAGFLVDRPVIERLEGEALELVSGDASASEVVERSRADARAALVRSLLRSVTVRAPDAGLIVDAVLDDLVRAGRLARSGDRLHRPGHEVGPGVAARAAMDRLERLLAAIAPPPLADAIRTSGCPPDGVRVLEASGRIVRLDHDLAYAASTYGELARTALRMAAAAALTPAALRDQTGTSRKYVMAILEDLDRRGILRREPDGHRPGPRSSLAAEFGRAVP